MKAQDRRLVVQAHVLRYRLTLAAVVHGKTVPRANTRAIRILWYSVAVAVLLLALVMLTSEVVVLIRQIRQR